MVMMNEPFIERAALFLGKASNFGPHHLETSNSIQKARKIVGALIIRNLVTPWRLALSYTERRRLSFVCRTKRLVLNEGLFGNFLF